MQEVLVREQKSKLNKGFSLVELIVVITIMAILVGVIATTFVRYVSRSHETANDSNVKILKDAADVALADPNLGNITASTFEISWSGGTKTITDNVGGNFKTALEANLDKNGSNAVYPEPSGGDGTFIITISGSTTAGYTSTVTFNSTGGGAAATTTP